MSVPNNTPNTYKHKPISKFTAIVCVLAGGCFGVHRFMMGYSNWWLMLLTFGGCGIWAFIDFIMILTGNMKMADGSPFCGFFEDQDENYW